MLGRGLATSEEQLILNLALIYSDKGITLSRERMVETVSTLVITLTDERKSKLRFASSGLGVKRTSELIGRNSSVFKFSASRPQDTRRFNSTNADTIINHFADLEALRIKYDLDKFQAWDLGEIGCSAGKGKHKLRLLNRFVNGYRNPKSLYSFYGSLTRTFSLIH